MILLQELDGIHRLGTMFLGIALASSAFLALLLAFVGKLVSWQEDCVVTTASGSSQFPATYPGSTQKYSKWREAADTSSIPKGPPTRIAATARTRQITASEGSRVLPRSPLGNLGPTANSEGEVEIGIRDLDHPR